MGFRIVIGAFWLGLIAAALWGGFSHGNPRFTGLSRQEALSVKIPKLKLPCEKNEKLLYKVTVLGIEAGQVLLIYEGKKERDGKNYYVIQGHARSSGLFAKLHRIDASYTSYLDLKGIFPYRTEFWIDDEFGRRDIIMEFNPKNVVVRCTKVQKEKRHYWGGYVPEFTQDPLSGFYWVRTKKHKVGDEFAVTLFSGRMLYRVLYKALLREELMLPVGRLPAIKLQMKASRWMPIKGIPRPRGSQYDPKWEIETFYLWLSDDEKMIPLKMEFESEYGKVIGTLMEITYK